MEHTEQFVVVDVRKSPLLATVVGRGTHIVKKPKGVVVYVEAIETFTVCRESATDPWKIASVAFIGYVYEGPPSFDRIKL